MGPENKADIWCWPYPIEPPPGPPIEPAVWDVLIVVKSGPQIDELIQNAASRFERITVLHYGRFERPALYAAARRARSCLYLSDDESGGLVTQEVMLAGCPVAGTERGAPLVEPGRTGARVAEWTAEHFMVALERCLELNRTAVHCAAVETFDTDRIASQVIGYLESVRKRW
jgi:hypothetical protein